jgi:RNA polymerase sigma factor (sigma-70 family)
LNMTESLALLAEYARSGSEAAFRELVHRYLGLVYGSALRLVGGDTHLAEDVAQTVFLDLARKAAGLSSRVMLGGWLHQRTFNVAAPMMRAQRRRQAHEREAVQMNALQDGSSADLAEVAPMLDEAITQLGTADRTAILLRFFEHRDFRAIGEALGSTEDAARMRVSRALEKLHALLKCRGVTLSVAALGTALASETLTAMPAGLATTIAGTALAGAAAGGGISVTLFKLMAMTKVKAGILSIVVVAGAATSLVVLQQARARLRDQDESLRQQSAQAAQLGADNERLSNLAARANSSRDQLDDLQRLRAEANSLRQKTNDLARLRDEARRRQQQAGAKPKTPLQSKEEDSAPLDFAHNWTDALRRYAEKHQGQFPSTLDQAASFLPRGFTPPTNVAPDQFELVYHGSLDAVPNWEETVIVREKEPRLDRTGKWVKVYSFPDGHSQIIAMPSRWKNLNGVETRYETFEAYEKDHIPASPRK